MAFGVSPVGTLQIQVYKLNDSIPVYEQALAFNIDPLWNITAAEPFHAILFLILRHSP